MNLDRLRKNRDLLFWGLHALGWGTYGLAQYVGAAVYETKPGYVEVVIIAAASGFLLSAPLDRIGTTRRILCAVKHDVADSRLANGGHGRRVWKGSHAAYAVTKAGRLGARVSVDDRLPVRGGKVLVIGFLEPERRPGVIGQ